MTETTAILRVAMAQAPPTTDLDRLFTEVANRRADILLFPEMFSNGYARFDPEIPGARAYWLDGAVDADSAYISGFRRAAKRYGFAIVATFLEAARPKPFNTACLIDRRGEIVLWQRKRHICFFDAPEEACAAGESSSVVVLETAAGPVRAGLMICMDREFPHVAEELMRNQAELVLVPNSCALMTDPHVGDVRVAGIRAMGFQSVMGIAVANYPAPKDDGHSLAVDALGRVLKMGDDAPGLVMADFDLTEIRALQAQEWFRRRP
ncbi:carbon-nitrogen hydrolase family protein [Tropicimonas marinistellae]|uniref:carbon-nitrogen hydrolase family protein n=1 Tax=Tropicimonas marinistellae TaxID=1739787 RepID=UPI00083441DE|nr:carbon-nitrogen hydrolase family protein [Tropicimonas marinistellae]